MKIRYLGIDTFEFSYGIVYEVVKEVPRRNGVVCFDNLDDESFLSSDCYEVIAE